MFRSLIILFIIIIQYGNVLAQTQDATITTKNAEGKLELTARGAAYFTNISMHCIALDTPHFNPKSKSSKEQSNYKLAKKDWPSFYGCYDWHSAVHNHWTLIKLLKTFPTSKFNPGIVARLEESFNAENIAAELKYFKLHELEMFEFPYGTTWLLKVAEELITWKDVKATKWLNNLMPLIKHVENLNIFYWPQLSKPIIAGNHDSYAFGLSFAIDYANTSKNDTLLQLLKNTAIGYFENTTNFNFDKEPNSYDFMSGGLVIADLMRKVYDQPKFENWFLRFAPKLLTVEGAKKILKVTKQNSHSGLESHNDGYQLNNIWCLNGIMKALSNTVLSTATKKQWITCQSEMWNYAQESIGVGNYDVDHCLSTSSVFALLGY
jgi:hypothetical protein